MLEERFIKIIKNMLISKKDKRTAENLVKRFKNIKIVKDKKSGKIAVLFRSKTGFCFFVLTNQSKLEKFDLSKNVSKN